MTPHLTMEDGGCENMLYIGRKRLSYRKITAKEPFFYEKAEENGSPSTKSRLKSRFSAKKDQLKFTFRG